MSSGFNKISVTTKKENIKPIDDDLETETSKNESKNQTLTTTTSQVSITQTTDKKDKSWLGYLNEKLT